MINQARTEANVMLACSPTKWTSKMAREIPNFSGMSRKIEAILLNGKSTERPDVSSMDYQFDVACVFETSPIVCTEWNSHICSTRFSAGT